MGWDRAGWRCLAAVLGDRAVTWARSTNGGCSGLPAPLECCHLQPRVCGCPGMCPGLGVAQHRPSEQPAPGTAQIYSVPSGAGANPGHGHVFTWKSPDRAPESSSDR